MVRIPNQYRQWFDQQGWTILPHQREMVARYQKGQSTLLTAPTGTGKTLAGFLGSLIDISQTKPSGLHTLYISPLKALNYDIERNVTAIIKGLDLPVRIESRTGDTTAFGENASAPNRPTSC